MATDSPQRAYQAPCPGCGAPVAFRSAQSTHAVCSYCQSTVVRDGETLKRIGKMAELFEDFSPLQLMASGRWQDRPFTLVGRLQYQYPEGRWTEWYALLDDGGTAYLAEDNGAYVLVLPVPVAGEMPRPKSFAVGAVTTVQGKAYTVTSYQMVQLLSAQGELPHLPQIGARFPIVELRSADGEVLSIDYGTEPATLARGRAVALEELQLRGLRDAAAKEDKGRAFTCPNCGASVTPRLDTSKSVVCTACNSIIDMSQGIGGELRHTAQDEPVQPLIPMGTTGKLGGADWQVVGFQHRMGTGPRRCRRAVRLERVPALQPPARLQLPGGRDRRLEPGRADHRRAADGVQQRVLRHLQEQAVRAEGALRGRDHLCGRRVLLAGATRPEDAETATSPTAAACSRWSRARTN